MLNRRLIIMYLVGFLVLSTSACSQLPVQSESETTQRGADAGVTSSPNSETRPAEIVAPRSLPPPISKGKQHIVELGSGEFVASDEPVEEVPSEPGNITLNF